MAIASLLTACEFTYPVLPYINYQNSTIILEDGTKLNCVIIQNTPKGYSNKEIKKMLENK
jgi:hypothetical protein